MAYQKVYSRINWENEPSTETPINEENLNRMDYALNEIDKRVVELDGYSSVVKEYSDKAEQSSKDALNYASSAKDSEANTKTYMNNASTYSSNAKTSETNAKVSEDNANSYSYNARISESNSKKSESNASSSAEVAYNFSVTALNNAEMAGQSATNAKASENNANMSASTAIANAKLSESYAKGGTGSRTGEDTDNAKYYLDEVKKVTPQTYAELTQNVDNLLEDTDIKSSIGESLTLTTSKGGLRLNKIVGKTEKVDNKLYSSGSMGYVDLGSLTWIYATIGTEGLKCFRTEDVTDMYYGTKSNTKNIGKLYCDKYSVSSYSVISVSGRTDKSIACYHTGGDYKYLYIIDESYTDATTFKNAMQGVMLAYELADGAIPSQYAEVVEEHSENLLKPMLATTTKNGITLTKDGAGLGTYVLNGTASARTQFELEPYTVRADGKYKVVGCPSGGSSSTYSIVPWTNSGSSNKGYDSGNGLTFDFSVSDDSNVGLWINIANGTVCNNLVFKPMLTTYLSATYDDYVPYSHNTTIIPLSEPLYQDNVINEDGVTKNYGCVDLGDLSWSWITTYGANPFYRATIGGKSSKYDIGLSEKYNIIHYTSLSGFGDNANVNDMVVQANTGIAIRTEGESVKPSGYFIYELATPTTEPLTVEQTKAIHSLKSYEDKTYVDTVDEYAKATLDVDYSQGEVGSIALDGQNLGESAMAMAEDNKKSVDGIIGADAWDKDKSYSVNNILVHNNSIYRVKVACKGIEPPNTSYYEPITIATIIAEILALKSN